MAIREYIGARYVPKFMGTYDNTQVYEALDVVDNGMGTSYISKIPTPAGTPLTNTTYWAIYGATSGAIINLQNQIDAIDVITDKVNNQLNGKCFILTDSYGTTAGNTGGATDTLQSYLDNIEPDKFDVLAGTGRSVGSGLLLAYLQNYCENTLGFDGSIYSTFIIAEGANEWSSTNVEISTQTGLIKAYIESQFPNAKIMYAWIANTDNNVLHNGKAEFYRSYRGIKTAMEEHGIAFTYGAECVLHNYNLLSGDGTHPTQYGKLALAWALANIANCGSYSVESAPLNINLIYESDMTAGYSSGYIREGISNNIMNLTMPNSMVVTRSTALDQASYAEIKIAHFNTSSALYLNHPVEDVKLPAHAYLVNPNDYTPNALNCDVVVTPDGYLSIKNVSVPAALRALNSGMLQFNGFGSISLNALLT